MKIFQENGIIKITFRNNESDVSMVWEKIKKELARRAELALRGKKDGWIIEINPIGVDLKEVEALLNGLPCG
ncbi:MAG: hypothetical protein ACP5JU_02830 [Minisyncoccia bacterium]